jgi:calcium permeable stress-gated cation channel
LAVLKLGKVDEKAAWYSLLAGLLPVIFLAILMAVLFMVIVAGAKRVVRFKSMAEVDSYTLHWHMLFQFANLWLILIGGSLFNQINALFKTDSGEDTSTIDMIQKILDVIARALPGASTFFVNMIFVSSFGAFGMELSMIPTYATKLILRLLSPAAARTQRQLDDAKTPPSLVWGQKIPPVIFIFLVSFLYMPIVPLIEVFGFIYFCGSYMVMKHQCLHVYAQEFEGGGEATWQKTFGFLMACLYIGQGVFISFMGIKRAPDQAALGLVPLIVTGYVHRALYRKFILPTRILPLSVAADVDEQDGELVHFQIGAYRQPAVDPLRDERAPLPYRRPATAVVAAAAASGMKGAGGPDLTEMALEDNV